MSEATMREGVLAAYRNALIDGLTASLIQTRERWCQLHPNLADDLCTVSAALVGEIDALYRTLDLIPAEREWDVETIAQEYIRDLRTWPPERRATLPTDIREAVSARVRELRAMALPRPADVAPTQGGADLALPPEESGP